MYFEPIVSMPYFSPPIKRLIIVNKTTLINTLGIFLFIFEITIIVIKVPRPNKNGAILKVLIAKI